MPFSLRESDRQIYPEQHWSAVYDSLLRPAVELAGLKCHCDNEDFTCRPIALNIWKKIEEADIILCDVSSSNPNVFMELGWAIRAGRPYVIAMDDLTPVPFDVADINRFLYDHALRQLALEEQVPKLARMLEGTLRDPSGGWSIIRHLGIASPANAKRARPRCMVDIYYYEQEFTRREANRVADELRGQRIPFRLMEHSDPGGPDAVFIGSLVEAEDARLIFNLVPYEVKFLFRPDYPEADGGDGSGYKIGLGYSSRYNQGRRIRRAEPVSVTKEELAFLLAPDHSNTSFQNTLWQLTVGPGR